MRHAMMTAVVLMALAAWPMPAAAGPACASYFANMGPNIRTRCACA